MRPIRLARIAAEAEGIRLRGLITRTLTRLVLAIVGFVFIVGALVFAHIAAWYQIRIGFEQSYLATAAILGAADLLVAIILILVASRSSPSRAEVEAYEVRRKAIEGIRSAASITEFALPALRLVSTFRGQRRRR